MFDSPTSALKFPPMSHQRWRALRSRSPGPVLAEAEDARIDERRPGERFGPLQVAAVGQWRITVPTALPSARAPSSAPRDLHFDQGDL
jgi:hypothetical protein